LSVNHIILFHYNFFVKFFDLLEFYKPLYWQIYLQILYLKCYYFCVFIEFILFSSSPYSWEFSSLCMFGRISKPYNFLVIYFVVLYDGACVLYIAGLIDPFFYVFFKYKISFGSIRNFFWIPVLHFIIYVELIVGNILLVLCLHVTYN